MLRLVVACWWLLLPAALEQSRGCQEDLLANFDIPSFLLSSCLLATLEWVISSSCRKTWRLYCSHPFTPPAIIWWVLCLPISYLAIFFVLCSWSHDCMIILLLFCYKDQKPNQLSASLLWDLVDSMAGWFMTNLLLAASWPACQEGGLLELRGVVVASVWCKHVFLWRSCSSRFPGS